MYKTLIHKTDKILAEWSTFDKTHYIHYIYVFMDDNEIDSDQRNLLLTSRIHDYIQTVLLAEKPFFHKNPSLLQSSIYVFFHSKYPRFDRIEYWGSFKDFNL